MLQVSNILLFFHYRGFGNTFSRFISCVFEKRGSEIFFFRILVFAKNWVRKYIIVCSAFCVFEQRARACTPAVYRRARDEVRDAVDW